MTASTPAPNGVPLKDPDAMTFAEMQAELIGLLEMLRDAATDPGDKGYTEGKLELVRAGVRSHVTPGYVRQLRRAMER